MNNAAPRIGVFGGSFDPVHLGHLTLIRWAIESLQLDRLRVIPAQRSWQKSAPGARAEQRLAMLELAIQELPANIAIKVQIDPIELQRPPPSYTVPTLESLRQELGDQPSLVLIIGSDQFFNLTSWHRYTEILGLAHIAVTQREQVRLQDFPTELEELLQRAGREVLPAQAHGTIVFFRMPLTPVSSTRLRADLAEGRDVGALLPPKVQAFIVEHHLYSQGV